MHGSLMRGEISFITWKKNKFIEVKEDKVVFDKEMQDRLWKISLDLCKDEKTAQIAGKLEKL